MWWKKWKDKFNRSSLNKKSYYLQDLDSLGHNSSYVPKASYNCYKQNVIVYRCVNLIAESAGHIPWVVYHKTSKDNIKIDSHPVYNLLNKPSPSKSGAEFFSSLISDKLIFGNAYILAIKDSYGRPIQLHSLKPNNVEVLHENGRVKAYKYNINGKEHIYPVSSATNQSDILHIKNYNPYSDFYGLSNLDAASVSIEVHTLASQWNYSLLKNGARPSGALFMKDNNAFLSEEQFERLKEQLYENYQGAANSGKPMLLEGGLDWREMSMTPKDMDYVESKNTAAREIALAFGVPPQILGITGDNTYRNMQEARLALWEETLLPLLDNLSDSLTNFLSAKFEEDIIINFNKDSISALSERRENIWAKLEHASFISEQEKRAYIGLPPSKDT